jgi:spermidine synthase
MPGVVFVSGAVLMALEMLGSRILAPYFGSSIFVWGSLISVFLASLSVGYFLGGSYADRRPSLKVLAGILVIPGLMVLILPWWAEPINNLLADADLGPRLGPLLSALLLFFVPSIFLGMVSPFAIKLQVEGLDTVGNTAGRLYAVSTLGSIVGTLLTSFFLITWLGVRLIVHLLGGVLLLLAVGVFVAAGKESERGERKKKVASRVLSLLVVLAMCVGWGHVSATSSDIYATKTVYQKDSLYHRILVVDEGGTRYLKFDASWQSAMDLREPHKLVFEYTDFFHLGPLLRPDARTSLFVGLGGGSVPKNFRVNYPELAMDVAELDPEVIRVAERYFDVKGDEKLRLFAKDGRTFLRKNKSLYDLAFIDAYFSDSIPFHLTTKEYLEELKAHMSANGVVVSNIIGAVSGPRSRLFRSMFKTFQEVFPHVYAFPVGWNAPVRGETAVRNIIVIAMMEKEAPEWADLMVRARSMATSLKVPSDMVQVLSSRVSEAVRTDDVPLLTDDYAPVDSLMHF